MALPASGNALAASAINTELGRTSTLEISLASAAAGTYATINTGSSSRPDATTPHSMSEWYLYDHSAASAPTLSAVSRATLTSPDCFINWVVRVGWTTSNANDTAYEIQVFVYGGGVIVGGQTTASSTYDFDTGKTGDAAYQDITHTEQYTIKLVRKSDSVVITSMDTLAITADTGSPC